jgi:5-methylcytosine-specific restriction endonuclease McrA
MSQKQAPLRLEYPKYEELRQHVLRRDGWRCQFCGSRLSVEVHNQHFRSHSGEDMEENLITLCANCHAVAHGTVQAK